MCPAGRSLLEQVALRLMAGIDLPQRGVPLPPVTIIIPHFNRRDMLGRALASLSRTRYPAFDIIVVANGGSDAALQQLVAECSGSISVRLVVPERNGGYAGGCNEGLRHTEAGFVVFMNDDTLHDPDWLMPLVTAAEADPGIAVLQPKILSCDFAPSGKPLFDYAGAAGGMIDRLGYPYCFGRTFTTREEDHGQYDSPRDLFWASGAALFARRELVVDAGGFDDSFFMQMEEIDLCWRLLMAGYRIRSVPGSVIRHEGGASLAIQSAEKIFFNHRNNLLMLLKNRSGAALMLLFPLRLLLDFAAMGYYVGRKGAERRGLPQAVWLALLDAVRRLPSVIRQRRLVQQQRKVPDRLLFQGKPFSVFLLR